MIKFLVAPVLGGVIGYITNDLAIKMLFRPRKAVYIGKFHIPFTPGLIPQQKSRIAASIGYVISSQLLNADTLKQTILSDSLLETIRNSLEAKLEELRHDEMTFRQKLTNIVEAEQVEHYVTVIREKGTGLIMTKLLSADIGSTLVDKFMQTMKGNPLFGGLLSGFMEEPFKGTIQGEIGTKVNSLIEENAPEIIENELGKLEEDLLNTRVCDICGKYANKLPRVIDGIVKLYQLVLDANLENILQAVDIERIVVDKVNSFSSVELEAMIFGIMKKELKAIVYLGAGLGFLMGFINLLF